MSTETELDRHLSEGDDTEPEHQPEPEPEETPAGDGPTAEEKKAAKREAAEQAAAEGAEALQRMAAEGAAAAGTAMVVRDRQARTIPGTDLPIIPAQNELQGIAAMAVTLSAANSLPPALRNHPNDVFLVLLTARDLGVSTTTAIREFHVIDGKVTISPKAKLAMARERGKNEGWRIWPNPDNTNTPTQQTWHATRADTPDVMFSYTYSLDEARVAGLTGKDNWKKYPKRMLSWRACGYLLDDVFPEVGTGLYSPDEMGAMTDEDGRVVIDVNGDPLPGMDAPKRSNRGGNSSGGEGGADKPASDEQKQAIKARIGRLDPAFFKDPPAEPNPDAPTARDALKALWTNSDGTDPLPPWHSLGERQVRRAEAMVKSIETRAERGEWGPWTPPDPDTGEIAADPNSDPPAPDSEDEPTGDPQNPPPSTPDSAGDATEPETAATTPPDPAEASTAPETPTLLDAAPPDPATETQDRIIAEVKAMKAGQIMAELVRRGLETGGQPAMKQQRLALAMWQETRGQADDNEKPAG